MASTASEYEPAWLQGQEVFYVFEAAGVTRPSAQQWLARTIKNRGIVADRPADASKDLFRLGHVILGYRGAWWRPNLDTIDWENFMIDAPYAWRRLSSQTPIEVSRELLDGLLRKRKKAAEKKKAGRKAHNREAVKKRVFKLMDHHGDFSADDPDWNVELRLVEKLEDELGISRTTLYEMISPMVDAWRRSKSGN
jgi:hypothetical protein